MAAEAVAAGTRGAPAPPRRATGQPPVAFDGLVEPGRPRLGVSEPSAPATAAPRSLTVTSGPGPGGTAGAPARSYAVPDCARSRRVSHAYDAPVAAEAIHAVLAVPVVMRRRVRGVRGVLHGAPRPARPLGDRTPDAAMAVARDVKQAPVVGNEARKPPALARPEPGAVARGTDREQRRGALHGAPRSPRPLGDQPPDTATTAAVARDVEQAPVVGNEVREPPARARPEPGAVTRGADRERRRGALHGAPRSPRPLGDQPPDTATAAVAVAMAAAHDVEQAPVVGNDARKPPARARPQPGAVGQGAGREQGCGAHAVVRAPVPRIAGRGPRAEPLAGYGRPTAPPRAGGGPPTAPPRAGGVTLAWREPDVLSWVTAGAGRPGTGPEAVRSCPRPAPRKPGVRTRGEAVSATRRVGPWPEDGWETCPFIRRRFEFPSA
ncbi:hypothetical protein [Streptomyces eurythermus]|uniref:hypothetical protein n=1 Tax=Streptomyces eurythermus TaxID=42237 RepID=UPI00167273A3|nr:hypothetical protein GCM10010236_30180 [Streptomyces eurythermus]